MFPCDCDCRGDDSGPFFVMADGRALWRTTNGWTDGERRYADKGGVPVGEDGRPLGGRFEE